jgi:hypothetical protein
MSIALPTLTIDHGERFGKLTVLEKIRSKKRSPKYRCGCVCGYSKVEATAQQLMRGRKTSCLKCALP